MTVYVDHAAIPAQVGRTSGRWSHLTADTTSELHAFAARLGLQRAWFQTCRNQRMCPPTTCPHWHYDVTESMRAKALRLGAQPIGPQELAEIITRRRDAGDCANRDLGAH